MIDHHEQMKLSLLKIVALSREERSRFTDHKLFQRAIDIATTVPSGVDHPYATALHRIADLGSCAHGRTPAYKLFNQSLEIAIEALK